MDLLEKIEYNDKQISNDDIENINFEVIIINDIEFQRVNFKKGRNNNEKKII